jgi:hypothetical protein
MVCRNNNYDFLARIALGPMGELNVLSGRAEIDVLGRQF